LDTYREAGVSSLAEAGILGAIDVAFSFLLYAIFGFLLLDVLGTVLLLEGAGLLLIGGALGFAGQPGTRRVASFMGMLSVGRNDKKEDDVRREIKSGDVRAAFYMMVGLWLFLGSMTLAVLGQSL
jgi:hypothetical protein